MKTTVLCAAIVAGMAMTAFPASADSPREKPDFASLDVDGDGAITLEELQAAGAARFAETDANGDGALSQDELIAQMSGRAERGVTRMIERLDENDDGVLQQSELEDRGAKRLERLIERADTNDDGVVSEEEFEQVKDRGGRRGGDGKHRHGRGHGGRG